MKDILAFSVPGSDSVHELQVGLALIRFAEFDLPYFKEQCVSLYRKNAPEDFLDKSAHLKEYLHSCHPYCKALLNADFDKIALDCVIDDIRVADGVGLEELWVRTMVSADLLDQELFKRITDYKTGAAVNQWTNLQRMQAYAVSKLNYIYGGGEADISLHKARKQYYDLIFTMTAAELGFQAGDLPKTEVSSVPFLQQSGALMKAAVNALAPRVKELTGERAARSPLRGGDCVRDQMAGLVIKAMAGLAQPDGDDVAMMKNKYGAQPVTVYAPAGFKAVLDLEFDQLLEKGFYIALDGKAYTRMKYSARREPVAEKPELPVEAAVPAPAPDEPSAPAELQAAVQATPAPDTRTAPVTSKPDPDIPAVSAPPKPAAPPVVPPAVPKKNAVPKEAPAPAAPGLPSPVLKKHAVQKEPSKEKTAEKTKKQPESPKAEAVKPPEKHPQITGITDIVADMAAGNTGKVRMIIGMAEDPKRTPSKKRSLQEVNTRCNLIWTSMNVQTGWSITSEDASEWFRYLTRLRYGINTGELPPEALDKFLDATLEVYKLLPDNS